MNKVLEQILDALSYLGKDTSEYVAHYGRSKLDGAPVGSGRYPLGSGDDPNQNRGDFVQRVRELRKSGKYNDLEIARMVGCKNTNDLRKQYSIAMNEQKNTMRKAMLAAKADGKTPTEIGHMFGVNESTVRSMLQEKAIARSSAAKDLAKNLERIVDEKGMIDVGIGVEKELGVTQTRLQQALKIMEDDGYPVYKGRVPQATNPKGNQQTTQTVACPPGTEHKEIYDFDKISSLEDYRIRTTPDGAERLEKTFQYPASMDMSRLKIRFRDEVGPDGHTGIERDGVIELRRGVPDLDLGNSHYAQVRILVDGDRYLKGMACYSDDMPDGVDVVFNTNKTPRDYRDVLKPIEKNPNNPFGALIKDKSKGGQYEYQDENGEWKLGLINKKSDEGDWAEWSKETPQQFLSKQPMVLINRQIKKSIEDKTAEFNEIQSLTNPVVRKQLLMEFAGKCDSAAEDLSTSAISNRQIYQVLMPSPTLAEGTCYAPQFRNGETIALIRFPHAGTFEVAILKVDNNHADSQRIYGTNAKDMVAVTKSTADRLSGADWDGDTALCIPCNSADTDVRILSTPWLEGLRNYDAKDKYGYTSKTIDANGDEHYFKDGHEFTPLTKGARTQNEMGKISNLITDMTAKGATPEEIALADRHSMTVIDAAKHKLDWKQSEIDNRIASLKRKYQLNYDEEGNPHYGASTLFSRAGGEVSVDKRQGTPWINQIGKSWYDPSKPEGALIYKTADDKKLKWVDEKGKEHTRTQKSTQMAEHDNAFDLSSGTVQETAFANYANWLKAKANEARKEAVYCPNLKYDPKARATYREEYDNLMHQLNYALLNSPRERQAQRAANSKLQAMIRDNPELKNNKKELGKRAQEFLTSYRVMFGAKRHPISITQRMWDAIQAGAVTGTELSKILRFADGKQVRELSMPKATTALSALKQSQIRALLASGKSTQAVADLLGISKSTVQKYSAA